MLTNNKQNPTKALHNACKALLASAFVLSFGFATQNPNPKETNPQEIQEAQKVQNTQETNEVATTQTPPPHTRKSTRQSARI